MLFLSRRVASRTQYTKRRVRNILRPCSVHPARDGYTPGAYRVYEILLRFKTNYLDKNAIFLCGFQICSSCKDLLFFRVALIWRKYLCTDVVSTALKHCALLTFLLTYSLHKYNPGIVSWYIAYVICTVLCTHIGYSLLKSTC